MIVGPFAFVIVAVVIGINDQCSCFMIIDRIHRLHRIVTVLAASDIAHLDNNKLSDTTVTSIAGNSESQKQVWDLPNGLKMEVICSSSTKDATHSTSLPSPILFIHGSFHGAWCYSEHYLSYFNTLGHDCYSISLRGTSGTTQPPSNYSDRIKVEQHVEDVSLVLNRIYNLYNPSTIVETNSRKGIAPIIVAHSFGGLILMKLLEIRAIREQVAAVALLCSVPPSGNTDMTKRFIRRDWIAALKIVWGFVFKAATFSPRMCQQLFFDESVSLLEVTRYMNYFKKDSKASLDLVSLAEQLPSKHCTPNGVASWITASSDEHSMMRRSGYGAKGSKSSADGGAIPARLVIGACRDFIVDRQGVEETAIYMGLSGLFGDSAIMNYDDNTSSDTNPVLTTSGAVLLPEMYHDVMLGTKWDRACSVIAEWLKAL